MFFSFHYCTQNRYFGWRNENKRNVSRSTLLELCQRLCERRKPLGQRQRSRDCQRCVGLRWRIWRWRRFIACFQLRRILFFEFCFLIQYNFFFLKKNQLLEMINRVELQYMMFESNVGQQKLRRQSLKSCKHSLKQVKKNERKIDFFF